MDIQELYDIADEKLQKENVGSLKKAWVTGVLDGYISNVARLAQGYEGFLDLNNAAAKGDAEVAFSKGSDRDFLEDVMQLVIAKEGSLYCHLEDDVDDLSENVLSDNEKRLRIKESKAKIQDFGQDVTMARCGVFIMIFDARYSSPETQKMKKDWINAVDDLAFFTDKTIKEKKIVASKISSDVSMFIIRNYDKDMAMQR